MTDQQQTLDERLAHHPHVKKRVERLLNIIENTEGDVDTAQDAETRVIDDLRKMGGDVLTAWALALEARKVEELVTTHDDVSKHGTKTIYWYTTFGEVRIDERAFLHDGTLLRPFSSAAQVKCRTYSLPLQRAITDFGADDSFADTEGKLLEHYGITVPSSAPRTITEKHAKAIHHLEDDVLSTIPDTSLLECVIAQTDGSMVPIVDTFELREDDGTLVDKRKTRKIRYKEARVTLAHAEEGEAAPIFGGTLGSPDEAGDHLRDCAIRAGVGRQTIVHCVGDGAPWIVKQGVRVFGDQATFLIDFYHLCEYLGAAAKICAPDDPATWLHEQKTQMKASCTQTVLDALLPYREAPTIPDDKAPVRCCYRYIHNRPGQFEYQRAIEQGLPIGSGEVESSHKYLIQIRLGIAGASWTEDNAENMIALRILRHNHGWDEYWEHHAQKVA